MAGARDPSLPLPEEPFLWPEAQRRAKARTEEHTDLLQGNRGSMKSPKQKTQGALMTGTGLLEIRIRTGLWRIINITRLSALYCSESCRRGRSERRAVRVRRRDRGLHVPRGEASLQVRRTPAHDEEEEQRERQRQRLQRLGE